MASNLDNFDAYLQSQDMSDFNQELFPGTERSGYTPYRQNIVGDNLTNYYDYGKTTYSGWSKNPDLYPPFQNTGPANPGYGNSPAAPNTDQYQNDASLVENDNQPSPSALPANNAQASRNVQDSANSQPSPIADPVPHLQTPTNPPPPTDPGSAAEAQQLTSVLTGANLLPITNAVRLACAFTSLRALRKGVYAMHQLGHEIETNLQQMIRSDPSILVDTTPIDFLREPFPFTEFTWGNGPTINATNASTYASGSHQPSTNVDTSSVNQSMQPPPSKKSTISSDLTGDTLPSKRDVTASTQGLGARRPSNNDATSSVDKSRQPPPSKKSNTSNDLTGGTVPSKRGVTASTHGSGLRRPSTNDAKPSVNQSRQPPPSKNGTTSDDPTWSTLPSKRGVTASSGGSRGLLPSADDTTSSIDLSRDPRPGARARLAAQNVVKARNEAGSLGEYGSSSRRYSSSSLAAPIDDSESGARARNLAASLGGYGSSSRRYSSSSQAAPIDDSEPGARRGASSRSSGPSDTVPGMATGAGADRLLGLARTSLPKGNVNGLCYSCEAKCGYPDSASFGMINCDSAFHRRQPHLKLLGGETCDRGWYHLPCAGITSGNEPNTWTCPSCVRRGTTSTDDDGHDEDDNDDGDDKSGRGGDDDSEDEYTPGPDTPGGDSDDDDGGDNDGGDQGDYKADREDPKKGRKSNNRASRKPDTPDRADEDQDGKDMGNAVEGENDQQQPSRSGKGKSYFFQANDNNSDEPKKKAKHWIEEEKVLAMDYMREVVDEQEIFGESRFAEVARRLQGSGYDREWAGVKNVWNRGLRERSGIDERKNKNAPLTTSKQDGETKKKRQERKDWEARNGRSSTTESNRRPSHSTKSLSPKRERQADDEEEVIPQKRRRASPYDGDHFEGLP